MVTTLNRQNPPSFDAAPTEVQMKLGISQVLSMPFAYNSPVIVLDFEVGNKNIIKGRFKDAIRSRVFEFEIGDSITFKPFTWKRTDSLDVDPVAWEDYSKGYCYRFDVAKTVRKEKPKCGNTSYNCGKACIGLNKNCKSDIPDKPSQEKVDKLRAAAGKFKAVQDDPIKKQEDNKLTPKPPETKPTLANEDKMRDTLKKAIAENELNKSLAETAYQKYHQYQNGLKNEAEGLSSRSIANLYQIPHATAVARINGLREAVGLGGSNAVSVDKELGGRINDLLNNGKQIKINSSGGQLKDQKKEPSQTTINADKKWSDFLDSKNVTEKGLRKLDPETRKKITEEFENTRIEERAQESSRRKGLSLPEDPKPSPNSTGVKGAIAKSESNKTLDIVGLARESRANIASKDKEAVSKNLEQWKQVVSKLESGEGIPKDINLNEWEEMTDNLDRLGSGGNVEFKKITGSISRILNKADSLNPLTQENLEKAHPNFRPIMQRINKTVAKDYELFDKKQRVQKELNSLKQEKSYNEAVILNNSKQFRETAIDNNYNELRLLTMRNPNDMIEVRNPVSNLPERTVSIPTRINEINKDIRDLADDKKAVESSYRAKGEIAKLQTKIKDAESRATSLDGEIKALRESRGTESVLSEPKPASIPAVAQRAIAKTKTDKPPVKSVDQQYKDIIASSKDPKGTEEALSSALRGGIGDFERKNYNEYLTAIASGTVPKGMGDYYQKQIDKYKPVIDAENFINERRQKAKAGDYETESEAGVYILDKLKQKGYKEHEYYDSPDYKMDYDKLKTVMKSMELPPPLSGNIPSKELKQTLTQGDKLLVKESTYSMMGGSSPAGYRIVDGGEVLKVNVKNVKTRVQGEYMGKPYKNEPSLALDTVTHVIRDGKRYKVDDSDSSPNDLKPDAPQSQKAVKQKSVKQKAVKQKTIKVQEVRSQEQESPLVPKEEIVKDAPKLIGDGTHEGTPKNAQEYYDAAVKTGKAMTMKEAEDTVAAVSGWSRNSSDIRNDQKKGKSNKKAELISDYVRNSTPYKGDIHRGIVFDSREEAMEWIKGDENRVLDNQNAHASWTSKETVAWVYTNPMMRKANKRLAGVIVSSVNKTGASIEKLSHYKESEAEILVAKDARHKVKSVTEKDGIIYVQTEEITNSDADKKIAPTAVQDFTAPRTLGNGTHEGTPKNAQEYSDMMAKKGQKIGIQDAEGVIESVKEWSENAYEIREDQKNGRSSKDADNLDLFIKQSTPFPGEISRGLKFDSEEELNKFVKGEDGILGNQNAHASWTSNYEKAKDFAGMNLSSVKKTYPVIVKAPNKSGVSIRNLSTFGQGEDEVVVSKNTRHKIKSVRKEGDLTIIETEEI